MAKPVPGAERAIPKPIIDNRRWAALAIGALLTVLSFNTLAADFANSAAPAVVADDVDRHRPAYVGETIVLPVDRAATVWALVR